MYVYIIRTKDNGISRSVVIKVKLGTGCPPTIAPCLSPRPPRSRTWRTRSRRTGCLWRKECDWMDP